MKSWKEKRREAYQRYILSPEWKALSKAARERDGECSECGSVRKLQAHHTLYRDRLEDTRLEDLKTLCRTCHRMEHKKAVLCPPEIIMRNFASRVIREQYPDESEYLFLFAIAAPDENYTQDVIRSMRTWRSMQFGENWEQATEQCLRIKAEAEKIDFPETELGLGDLCEFLWEKYKPKEIKNEPKLGAVVEQGGKLVPVG